MNDGGPAFPSVTNIHVPKSGMSLRDYFAAHAMRGLTIAHPDWGKDAGSDKRIAEIAYHLADAMLAERNSERPSK